MTAFHSDHPKQADQSWGGPSGNAEWNDEKAGEAIAQAEETGGWDSSNAGPAIDMAAADTTAEDANTAVEEQKPVVEPEPEPEDNSKSYADYLAEQAEKKLQLNAKPLEARKANEGSKQKKEWANAKPLEKAEDEEYFAGKGEKTRRERERKEKNILDVDFRYQESDRGGDRGRGRGGRARGEGRGGFRGGDRGGRGSFRGRGDGGFRGGRGGRGDSSVNVTDENAFPSLGGS